MYCYGVRRRWGSLQQDYASQKALDSVFRERYLGLSYSNDLGVTSAPRSFDSAPRFEECKCLFVGWWCLQVGRFECFENCAKRWYALHLNRYTLLRKPRSLEGLALRQQKWYLVPGVRYLWDDNAQSAFYSFKHGQTFLSGSIRLLLENSNIV